MCADLSVDPEALGMVNFPRASPKKSFWKVHGQLGYATCPVARRSKKNARISDPLHMVEDHRIKSRKLGRGHLPKCFHNQRRSWRNGCFGDFAKLVEDWIVGGEG